MSIKELNEIVRTDIPYDVRLKMAINIRDFTDVASRSTLKDFSVESFNNTNMYKDPDSVGITIWHPNKKAPTHMIARVYPLGVGVKQFQKEVKLMDEELNIKAGV